MSAPPSVVIVIAIEARTPRVYVDATSDAEYLRLEHWIRCTPQLAGLVRLAVELEHENGAA
jgi:hypothetical protein